MKTSHVGFCLVTLLLGLPMVGCSPRNENTPPPDQVRAALAAALPPYLSVTGVESESIPIGPDQAKTNVKVTVAPKESLYISDRRIPGDPSILLIKPVQAANGQVTLYGFLQAQRAVDRWTLSTPKFTDGFEGLGKPRNSFGPQCYVSNTPEATAAIQALQAHADELERQIKEREEKERQARQAAAEQKQREEQAARDRLLRATAPGTHYVGTITNNVSGQSQRLRLNFTAQEGLLLRAEVINPDQLADHRPLSGAVVLPSGHDEAADPGKDYPVQLSASTGKLEVAKGRWNFYCNDGALHLRLDEHGGLEGDAAIYQTYAVRLQREP